MRVGLDIVEVTDFAKTVAAARPRFLHATFSSGELRYCEQDSRLRNQRLATTWAAKEAVLKVLGGPVYFRLRDIEIARCSDGRPSVRLHGPAVAIAREREIDSIELSLSHDGSLAAAVAMAGRRQTDATHKPSSSRNNAMSGQTQPTATPEAFADLEPGERTLARNLALASRILSAGGHDDLNQGQVSARLPGREDFLIKAAVVGFNEARPEDMVRAHIDGEQPVPAIAPPELPLHQAVYMTRPDVNAIVHSHAPHTLVFGATSLNLRAISHDGAFFEGRVPRFTDTSNTVLDLDTGNAIANALGDNPALFLQNHGGLVVGHTLREATVFAQLLERAAQLQLLAESAGSPYTSANDHDIDEKRSFVYSATAVKSYWQYGVRRIHAEQPETREW